MCVSLIILKYFTFTLQCNDLHPNNKLGCPQRAQTQIPLDNQPIKATQRVTQRWAAILLCVLK